MNSSGKCALLSLNCQSDKLKVRDILIVFSTALYSETCDETPPGEIALNRRLHFQEHMLFTQYTVKPVRRNLQTGDQPQQNITFSGLNFLNIICIPDRDHLF